MRNAIMINTDPALTLNRNAPDPLSPAVPITVDTPCPRCGGKPTKYSHYIFDTGINYVRCQECGMVAIEGDDTWVNAKACEGSDPTPFLRTRLEAIRKRSVSV